MGPIEQKQNKKWTKTMDPEHVEWPKIVLERSSKHPYVAEE